MSEILGVVVIARNGDRIEYHQDPKSYGASFTETTPLGVAQSHQLGTYLRNTYLSQGSPSWIKSMHSDLVDNQQLHVRVKGGGEGTVVFDSAIALLQGLYPPTPKNKILLANDTTIVAPLGGYQYVPVETVEPGNDRSLESWTDCPNFADHVAKIYASDDFKAKERESASFFHDVRDYIFGNRAVSLQNIWNVYDYMHSELTHNKTYAYRLPPTFVDQARHWANYHEQLVFTDNQFKGIGNIAGRTLLHTIIESLERIAFNHDPLTFLHVETTYQPFISLSHLTEVVHSDPDRQVFGIPNYAGALAIELRRGPAPDSRDFLRFKFKNGTVDQEFEPVHVFGHRGDIPLTEFIYKARGAAITSNREWAQVCGVRRADDASVFTLPGGKEVSSCAGMIMLVAFFALFGIVKFAFLRHRKCKARRAATMCEEGTFVNEKA